MFVRTDRGTLTSTLALFLFLAMAGLTGCGGGGGDSGPPVQLFGTLVGHVYSTSGVALQGAQVSCAGNSQSTDQYGFFRISGIPLGTHTVQVTMSGYKPHSEQVTFDTSHLSVGITVRLEPTGGGDPTKYGAVAGHVYVTGTQTAISGVTVTCGGVSSTTETTGSYRLDHVPSGDQTIRATKSDFEPYQATVHVPENSVLTYDIHMTSSILTTSLSGTVTDYDTGRPLSGMTVHVGTTLYDETDANGHYQIPNVPQGNQTVSISEPAYVPFSASVYLYSAPKVYDIRLMSRTPTCSVSVRWQPTDPGFRTLWLYIRAHGVDHDNGLMWQDPGGNWVGPRFEGQWRGAQSGHGQYVNSSDFSIGVIGQPLGPHEAVKEAGLQFISSSPQAPIAGEPLEVTVRVMDHDGNWSPWAQTTTIVPAYP